MRYDEQNYSHCENGFPKQVKHASPGFECDGCQGAGCEDDCMTCSYSQKQYDTYCDEPDCDCGGAAE
jgi:hypothetical protein